MLLNQFEEMAERVGWPTVFREISGNPGNDANFRSMMASLTHQIVLKIDRRQRLGETGGNLINAIKRLRPKISPSDAGTLDLTFTLDSESGLDSALSVDLTEVFLELGKVAKQHKIGVLILLDEVQNLEKGDLSALIMALHRVSQKNLPVVVIAAGLPNLPKLASQVETYVERLFKIERIGQLDEAAARAALVDPAEVLGVIFTKEAVNEVLKMTDRWPYFLQEWGQKVWDEADSSLIEQAEIDRVTPLVLAELDNGFFRTRYDRATDRERDYMYAMASLGKGPYIPTKVMAKTEGDTKTWPMMRARLIGKGLIYSPSHGQIDFTIPHFGDFLLREKTV